jgi:hypothetical protein
MKGKLKNDSNIYFIGDSTLKQQFVHFACMLNPNLQKPKLLWNDFFVNWNVVFQVTGKDKRNSTRNINLKLYKVGLNFEKTHKNNLINSYNKTLYRILKDLNRHDIAIVNHGLHYNFQNISNDARELRSLAATTASVYKDVIHLRGRNNTCTLLWRETTPQHFPTPNGLWDDLLCRNHTRHEKYCGKCSKLTDSKGSVPANIRNEVTSPIILNSTVIPIIAVYEDLKFMDPSLHFTRTDCTHNGPDILLYLNLAWLDSI